MFAKPMREMSLAAEAGFERDLGDRETGSIEEVLRDRDSPGREVAMRETLTARLKARANPDELIDAERASSSTETPDAMLASIRLSVREARRRIPP